jgi:hypothetical protein
VIGDLSLINVITVLLNVAIAIISVIVYMRITLKSDKYEEHLIIEEGDMATFDPNDPDSVAFKKTLIRQIRLFNVIAHLLMINIIILNDGVIVLPYVMFITVLFYNNLTSSDGASGFNVKPKQNAFQ